MNTHQEFKFQITYTLLDKFFRSHQFEDLTEEVVERINTLVSKLCPEQKEDKHPDCDIPLDTKLIDVGLGFSPLLYIGIITIGDLLNYSPYDLLRLRNFGKKSLTDIENFLEKHNLKLKGR